MIIFFMAYQFDEKRRKAVSSPPLLMFLFSIILCLCNSFLEVLTGFEIGNIVSRNDESRVLADVTSCLLSAMLECPSAPTADINVFFLNE